MDVELSRSKPAVVLLAEDNVADVVLTRESFADVKLRIDLHHVENGKQCMAFLRKEGEYVDAPTPDLLLLDLNMPVMNGREVMQELIKDKCLNHLPVVILTTSNDERDVLALYKLRCNEYITKPIDFHKFRELIQSICKHWFTVVELPRNTD
jgi:CheY-like chemotaxis protein